MTLQDIEYINTLRTWIRTLVLRQGEARMLLNEVNDYRLASNIAAWFSAIEPPSITAQREALLTTWVAGLTAERIEP